MFCSGSTSILVGECDDSAIARQEQASVSIVSISESFTSVQKWEASAKMNLGQPMATRDRLSAAALTIPQLSNTRQFPCKEAFHCTEIPFAGGSDEDIE